MTSEDDDEEARRMALAEMARGTRRARQPAAITVVIGSKGQDEDEEAEEGMSPKEC
jgi:hypothetical protein